MDKRVEEIYWELSKFLGRQQATGMTPQELLGMAIEMRKVEQHDFMAAMLDRAVYQWEAGQRG